MENVRDILARNVRLNRQRLRLTQLELAERAGIDITWIGRIERGIANPSLDVIGAIAAGLSISTSALLKSPGSSEG